MAHSVEDFIKLDLTTENGDGQKCTTCKADLREDITGYQCATGASCSDCYFDALSKLIESKPVCIPALRR